ncbi:riboflavin kinase [Spiroplasma culicicola]|uniref:riboflavin kinase n=1 Tax=Spiroplasma culicicola AES-1 TaxID=1276246 RepID=W6AGS7_9MOLU|nr:riboflavin kinase [Spiroplasma culicicola]AHI52894.1 riboflavin kinase/FAD synthetase [Spiroplasma culicicola AES-1]
MTSIFTYNNLSMIMLHLQESVALICDFENWCEFENQQIEKLKLIAKENNLSTTLLVPIAGDTNPGLWNQNNIGTKAKEFKIDQVIFYVIHPMMKLLDEQSLYQNLHGFLNLKKILKPKHYTSRIAQAFNSQFFEKMWKEDFILGDNFLEKKTDPILIGMLYANQFEQFYKATGLKYQFSARVVEGKKLGRQLGYPTINLLTPDLIPVNKGVYACDVYIEHLDQHFLGAGCYWKNELDQDVFEIFLLDFDKEIYGWKVDVTIIEKIRDSIPVTSIQHLKELLAGDVLKVKDVKSWF